MRQQSKFKKCKINNEFGMSFLEMMFTLIIFTGLFAILYQFVRVSQESWSDAEATMRLRQQAEYAIEAITQELRNTIGPETTIIKSPVGGTLNYTYFVPDDVDTGSDVIGFRLPAVDVDTETVVQGSMEIKQGNRVIYYVDDEQQLWRVEYGSSLNEETRQTLARHVSLFEAEADQNFGPTYVDVHLNFDNEQISTLSRRALLLGASPSSSSYRRGAGIRIGIFNSPSKDYESGQTKNYEAGVTTYYSA